MLQTNKRFGIPRTRGFTLIETMVSVIILTFTLGGFITTVVFGLRSLGIVKDKQLAAKIAREGMEWVVNKRDNNIECLIVKCDTIALWDENLVGVWQIDATKPKDLRANKKFKDYAAGEYICLEKNGPDAGKFTYCNNNPDKVLPQHFERRVEVVSLGGEKIKVESRVTWDTRFGGTQTFAFNTVLFGIVPAIIPGVWSHWALDDGSGSTAADSIGNSDGTLINGPVWVPGIFGSALQFDGVDDYVELPPSASVKGLRAASVSAWVFFTPTSDGRVYFESQGIGGATRFGIRQNLNGEVETTCRSDGDVSPNLLSPSAYQLNTWHHIAATCDTDADQLILYVDGTQAAIDTSPRNRFSLTSPERPIAIGANTGNLVFTYFTGKIDDVRLYNRALSPREMNDIYGGL